MREKLKNLTGVKKWLIIGVFIVLICAVFTAGIFTILHFNSTHNPVNNSTADFIATQQEQFHPVDNSIYEFQAIPPEQFRLPHISMIDLQDMQTQSDQIPVSFDYMYRALIMADMANRVETLTQGLDSEQEKALAVARWVAANISSRPNELAYLPGMNNIWTYYSERAGLCLARSQIFIEMLKLINIPAVNLGLFDFPTTSDSHATVHVWYDNSWHFFDVTYGGVFMDGDNIMSFEQIVANPEYAMENMVVFEDTLDKHYVIGSYFDENSTPTVSGLQSPYRIMRSLYNVDTLTGFRSFGYYYHGEIVTVYPRVDAGQLPITIGTLDGSWEDVRYNNHASESGITGYVAYGLAGRDGLIKVSWEFYNCDPETEYYIKYYIYGVQDQPQGSRFFAAPSGARIVSGQDLILNDNMMEWTIVFKPIGYSCSILIDFDISELRQGALIDMVEIGIVT